MTNAYLRNELTGEIHCVPEQSDEYFELAAQRTPDGRPLNTHTGSHDADPEQFASAEEVAARRRFAEPLGLPLSDVSADGMPKSERAREAMARAGESVGAAGGHG